MDEEKGGRFNHLGGAPGSSTSGEGRAMPSSRQNRKRRLSVMGRKKKENRGLFCITSRRRSRESVSFKSIGRMIQEGRETCSFSLLKGRAP